MNILDLKLVPQGAPELNIQAFDCGRKSVNDFFHNEAHDYQEELFGKTYYWVIPERPMDIVAGFTVANASIFTKRLPNARQKKIGFEVHHEKGLINYPSILLAQLGVDIKYKGLNLGQQIIEFVMQWFTSPDNKSGCRHLIVDAYDEPHLLDFYQRNGLNLFFSSVEQEMEYRNWDKEKDGALETRLMFRDMILLKRPSIRR
ncbi:MAG: N-acetyltransferase [Bacteroidaceae bacterium]|nr:N-acetyltransferase [Bacteroidaceae bacterium]